jgi:hypothetical protein
LAPHFISAYSSVKPDHYEHQHPNIVPSGSGLFVSRISIKMSYKDVCIEASSSNDQVIKHQIEASAMQSGQKDTESRHL